MATIVVAPAARASWISSSPIGPQPITIAVSPFLISLRRTACRAMAIGSVSAAVPGNPYAASGTHPSPIITSGSRASLNDRPAVA